MTDAAGHLAEKATYCKPNDPKRPSLVGLPDATTSQICPEDGSAATQVADAYPDGWYVRVMFDELLNPAIEELVDEDGAPCDTTSLDAVCSGTIAGTHPVDLQCVSSVTGMMVNVDYDGYYSPAGNAVTWPLGPSLVIKPNDPLTVATNTECQVTLGGHIVDKDGEPVPMDQRGPFKFKIAPITSIFMDPVADDPDFEHPIDALTIYFDNPYIQFNTFVDLDSLCPDDDADGLCDNSEAIATIKDVAHPDEGPGYCNTTFEPCGSLADCDTTAGDTLCGKGFCGTSGDACNVTADCPANDNCGALYAYDYVPFGLSDTEYGIGPPEPVETEHKYIFSFTAGAKLRDRCGVETTLPTPTATNGLLGHFITNKFDFNSANITTGETASAMKRLQFNWNNVLEHSDFAPSTGDATRLLSGGLYISGAIVTDGSSPGFTISPLPKKMTAACQAAGAGCATTDLALDELMILAADASGQMQLQGHLQMNTEYTATLKAGTIIKDFYGKTWTNTSDQVIKWKTAEKIAVTSIGVRQPGKLINIADGGTVVLPTPTTTMDIRIGFNASMDPTTLEASEVSIETVGEGPTAPTLSIATPSGCGNFVTTSPQLLNGDNRTGWIGACSLRVRGLYRPGTYKFTLKKDASMKDIFGTTYTQAADQSLTFTVVDAAAPVQCL